MCGIAGLHLAVPAEQSLVLTRRMIDQLVHRGPDAEGLWQHPEIGLCLGHRRLAIQDLSPNGSQPMQSPGGRYRIVFNGEIYNFREIADELRRLGRRFRGGSDTEVLLQAVEEWGLGAALCRFSGMFAFALWDEQERTLSLCRDRLGEKPLYYGWIGDGFFFASELSAIEQAVSSDQLQIDPAGLNDYLQNGYISAPSSIYLGVYKLPPGCRLDLHLDGSGPRQRPPEGFSAIPGEGRLSPQPYWALRQVVVDGLQSPLEAGDAVDELEHCLRETVRRQLVADVDVGCFLSGGIDSSVVAALAHQESPSALKTFTIGFEEQDYDESGFAEAVARHLGTDHQTLQVSSGDVLNLVPGIAEVYDEPFADSSQLPAFLVSRLAREHVTVCLSGDGGDELFAGYNRYLWTRSLWQRLCWLPHPLRDLLGRGLAAPSPAFWDRLYGRLSRSSDGDYERQKLVGLKLQKLAGFMRQKDIHKAYKYLMSYWLHPEVLTGFDAGGWRPEDFAAQIPARDFIDQAMYMDQSVYLPGDNLAKVDRASMAVSLETRLPLLSHEVVELAWRIPLELKVREGKSKWVLREVLYRHVPKALIERPKMGFSVPVAHWLRNELRGWGEAMIASMDDSLLSSEVVKSHWQEHLSGRQDHSHRLWTVLMFIGWQQHRR